MNFYLYSEKIKLAVLHMTWRFPLCIWETCSVGIFFSREVSNSSRITGRVWIAASQVEGSLSWSFSKSFHSCYQMQEIFSCLLFYPTCNWRRFTTFSLEHFTSVTLPFVSTFQPFFIETNNLRQLRRRNDEIFTEYNK